MVPTARLLAAADGLQQRHAILGFPYAVWKKYSNDAAGRQAALITYYGFLSMFPLLLVAVSILSWGLVNRPALRTEMVEALVPPSLQDTVNTALIAMPTSGLPLAIGLVGLLFSATGVVRSAYETLNHVAGVPLRSRFGFVSRYARLLLMLVVVLAGGLVVAALTVAAGALPDVGELQRVAAGASAAVVVFIVLVTAARVLMARPVTWRSTWLAAATGAVAVALVLSVGARLLSALVTRAGPVYGSFATVAGIFALLYLVSQTLLYAAEAAVVRSGRLWPRALDITRPTSADRRALLRLVREQERREFRAITVEFEGPPG
jgi:membrane protein